VIMSIIEKALDRWGDPPARDDLRRGGEGKDTQANEYREDQEKHWAEIDAKVSLPDPSRGRTSRRVTLDMEILRTMGIIDPRMPHTVIAEEYRRIKQPLLKEAALEARDGLTHSNLIMVTSALAGEGKTFTAINLAMSIAMEKDRTVLLVDADPVKRGISRVFGLDADQGLIDLIRDQQTLVPDVLVRTNISKLSVLPAGQADPHYTELYASAAMRWLTEELSARYSDRIMVFDTPPLLAASATSALVDLMDRIVLVVEAGKTPQHSTQEAIQLLGSTKPVGLVLNKSRAIKHTKYSDKKRQAI
jgi:protein-tyrosine kinase